MKERKHVTKWVVGEDWQGNFVAAAVIGYFTPAYFLVDRSIDEGKNGRLADIVFRHATHIKRDDKRLFDTKEEAIAAKVKQLEESHEALLRKAEAIPARIAEVKAL